MSADQPKCRVNLKNVPAEDAVLYVRETHQEITAYLCHLNDVPRAEMSLIELHRQRGFGVDGPLYFPITVNAVDLVSFEEVRA